MSRNRHFTNDLSVNSSNEVIVYRSRSDQMVDQWLYEDGGFVIICLIMLISASVVFVGEKIANYLSNRRY